MSEVTLADLDPVGHTSFSFYDFLPGLGLRVRGAPAAATAGETAEQLLGSDLVAVEDAVLDRFAAVLLTHGSALAPDERFELLARSTARAFAILLADDRLRPRRMRLTRLSLMLRVILDRDADTSGVLSDTVLPCRNPWDLIEAGGCTWAASCDEDNLRQVDDATVRWSRRAGLPTQLDRLGDSLWVGSYYSAGGHVLRFPERGEPELTAVAHPSPLVLAFEAGAEHWMLDATGALWVLQGTAAGRKLAQLPGQVHRARVIGSNLYAFDWSQPGVGTVVDLERLQASQITTGDIIVCNDVCGHDGLLYGICKLQGRVFKMSADWTTLDARLGAGSGTGRLLDPIMIRSQGEHLAVLNWFSARLVRLAAF